MIQKLKSNREREREKERGKKRYLERVIEEHEAKEEIKDYDRSSSIEDDLQVLQARKTNRSISS